MSFGTNSQMDKSVNNLNAGASTGLTAGSELLPAAGASLAAPASYYQSILQGGPAATSALAPDVNRTRAAGDSMIQNESTLAPRGGGRGSVLFNTPQQVNSQVQSIFNTARPMAAQGLTQVGGTQGSVGTGAVNAGTQASGMGFQAGSTEYQNALQTGLGIAGLLTGPLTMGLGGAGGAGGIMNLFKGGSTPSPLGSIFNEPSFSDMMAANPGMGG